MAVCATLVSRRPLRVCLPPRNPPAGHYTIAEFIQTLEVRAEGVPPQPWIHLVHSVVHFHLLRQLSGIRLNICLNLKQEGISPLIDDYVTMHLTHDSLPKSLASFPNRFDHLELKGINFRRVANFLRFVRSFRLVETLYCLNIVWFEYPRQLQLFKTTRYSPLKRITFPAWSRIATFNTPVRLEPGWISLLWSTVRRRYYDSVDGEAWSLLRITSYILGFYRRKHIPRLQLSVRERFATVGGRSRLEGTCAPVCV